MAALAAMLKPTQFGWVVLLTDGRELARFFGPILMGFLYDLAQARGAFYGGAALTAAALVVALAMRRMPLLEE